MMGAVRNHLLQLGRKNGKRRPHFPTFRRSQKVGAGEGTILLKDGEESLERVRKIGKEGGSSAKLYSDTSWPFCPNGRESKTRGLEHTRSERKFPLSAQGDLVF